MCPNRPLSVCCRQGTKIDPMLTRDDRLVGQVLGLRGQLPQVRGSSFD